MNVFIHRRDLRTEDNTTLLKMLDLLKKEKDIGAALILTIILKCFLRQKLQD